MRTTDHENLRLKDQVCFPLYACSREVIKLYKPALDKIGLTYTQYITMLVLWEKGTVTAKELGELLYLDSGTLTPLLKKLEARGYLSRRRGEADERILIVSITPAGKALKNQALTIPEQVSGRTNLSEDESATLYRLLYKILGQKSETKE